LHTNKKPRVHCEQFHSYILTIFGNADTVKLICVQTGDTYNHETNCKNYAFTHTHTHTHTYRVHTLAQTLTYLIDVLIQTGLH